MSHNRSRVKAGTTGRRFKLAEVPMGFSARLSFKTMDALAALICGNNALGLDAPLSLYRTQEQLDEFFRASPTPHRSRAR